MGQTTTSTSFLGKRLSELNLSEKTSGELLDHFRFGAKGVVIGEIINHKPEEVLMRYGLTKETIEELREKIALSAEYNQKFPFIAGIEKPEEQIPPLLEKVLEQSMTSGKMSYNENEGYSLKK